MQRKYRKANAEPHRRRSKIQTDAPRKETGREILRTKQMELQSQKLQVDGRGAWKCYKIAGKCYKIAGKPYKIAVKCYDG